MRSVEEMSLRWLKEDEVRVDDGTPWSLSCSQQALQDTGKSLDERNEF